MNYAKLVDLYGILEKIPSKLSKTEEIAAFFGSCEGDDLPAVVLLLQGRVFPSYSEKEIGIADKMAIRIIGTSLGFSETEIVNHFRNTGDLGLTVESLMKNKKQRTLFRKQLTIRHVLENMRRLSDTGGKGSQEVKIRLISELIAHASPKEAKYIIRTALEELRIGVAEGIIRDAIAKAFLDTSTKESAKESVKAVEWAWFMRPDYAEIALLAKDESLKGLRTVKPRMGVPMQPLLSEKSPGLREALEAYDNPAVEYKYDGIRMQIQKDSGNIWLFTRRLEDVTDAFPDIVKLVRENVKADRCIMEGEALAVHPENGEPLPFQEISKRVHRKHEIKETSEKIPVQVNLFDVTVNGKETLFDRPLRERRRILESMISQKKNFLLAKQLVTKDLKRAEKFYLEALRAKQEGVMVKNLDAPYQPGRRVAGGWLKVKPIMETLDLVITGGIWGTGKRAGWLGSFIISCRDEEGGFLECGMMGTGIKEKKTDENDITFVDLTKMLKPYVEKESGNKVIIKPRIVVEVAYEEIQKSPNYSSGYALRFPRLVRLRTDEKSARDADTIERINHLFKMQKGKRSSV